MPSDMHYVYWDSCLFLYYINGDEERYTPISTLLSVIKDDKRRKILTSSISVVEVAFATTERRQKVLDPQIEEAIDAIWKEEGLVELVEFHYDIAVRARRLMRETIARGWSMLSPRDAIHLASADWVNGQENISVEEFNTYDAVLSRYSDYIGCPIQPPYIEQARLPDV